MPSRGSKEIPARKFNRNTALHVRSAEGSAIGETKSAAEDAKRLARLAVVASRAEQTTDRAHDEDRGHGSWIVYEHNGGENGHTDRVYGPYHDRKQAGRVASYINTFTTVLGRAWVLPLRDPKDGPDPLGDPHA